MGKNTYNRGTWVTTSIHNVLAIVALSVVEKRLDTWLHKTPCASIERLFLAPDNSLRVRVHVEVISELLPREGVELFNTRDGSVLKFVVCPMFVQRGVDLSRAEHHPLDLLRLIDALAMLGIGDDPLELTVAGKLLNRRAREGVTEKGLGEEHDEG